MILTNESDTDIYVTVVSMPIAYPSISYPMAT